MNTENEKFDASVGFGLDCAVIREPLREHHVICSLNSFMKIVHTGLKVFSESGFIDKKGRKLKFVRFDLCNEEAPIIAVEDGKKYSDFVTLAFADIKQFHAVCEEAD